MKEFKELRDITVLANKKKRLQVQFENKLKKYNKLTAELNKLNKKMMNLYVEIESIDKVLEDKKDEQ